AALAAPGDPRAVQGTLMWPPALGAEPFVVIRADDGRYYYADVTAAQRRTEAPVTAGGRVSVVGVEGVRPHEVAALSVGAGDLPASALTPPEPAEGAPGPEPLWRLHGTVQSMRGTTLTLRTADGRVHDVDVSRLSERTRLAVRPGEEVTLFGVPAPDQTLVANGFIQSEPYPAASPGAPR
ncbi:MAG TPA: hypothetical protein VFX28_02220, partial [Methylomirabilota bacterium]|nr:hypothetical protein [Methylomirabilota bacterium]